MSYSLKKAFITGTLIGSAIATGLYVASAVPGTPPNGLVPKLLGDIVDPTDPSGGTARNTNSLSGVESRNWQRNVGNNCTGRTWATGVNADNNLICKSW